jgi:hypothetical protein
MFIGNWKMGRRKGSGTLLLPNGDSVEGGRATNNERAINEKNEIQN